MSPRNASINGDGFRMYEWPGGDTPLNRKYDATEPTKVLSVTSIRSLAGEPFQLVNWKLANVINLAMGVRKQTRIGPRGGVKQVYVKDGPFPGEFVRRMADSRGIETVLDDVRRWLRETADEPRDVAAVRGSVVHKMIETNVTLPNIDEKRIRDRFTDQWKQERRRVRPDVNEEDVTFVRMGMEQYWDMRVNVPFVILAQEPQVWNLTAGYAGSADVLMWFLGTFRPDGVFVPIEGADPVLWQAAAAKGLVTIDTIREVGGTLALGDWKTSPKVYTNHVVQGTAYLAAEFVGSDGIIDERLTAILKATLLGLIIKIRPDGWELDFFDVRQDVLYGFLGSVAFARLLATHKEPGALFWHQVKGAAPGTGKSEIEGEDDAA